MLEDAAVKGVRSVHLFTVGLAETGISERRELQQLPTDPGSVAFFSQSGTTNDAAYNSALRGLRFSKVISFGNASMS